MTQEVPEGSVPTEDGGYEYEPATGTGLAEVEHPADCQCSAHDEPFVAAEVEMPASEAEYRGEHRAETTPPVSEGSVSPDEQS